MDSSDSDTSDSDFELAGIADTVVIDPRAPRQV